MPIEKCTNSVHRITCKDCGKCYIFTRYIITRTKEHKKSCNKTNSTIAEAKNAVEFEHTFNFENFVILSEESSYFNRLFMEMYHIKNNNTVNLSSDIGGISGLYNSIILSTNRK